MLVNADRQKSCYIGYWNNPTHLHGYGRIIPHKGEIKIGIFENTNIISTTAKPKKSKKHVKGDLKKDPVANEIDFKKYEKQ